MCIELREFEFEVRVGIKIWGSGGVGRGIDLPDLSVQSGSRPFWSFQSVS